MRRYAWSLFRGREKASCKQLAEFGTEGFYFRCSFSFSLGFPMSRSFCHQPSVLSICHTVVPSGSLYRWIILRHCFAHHLPDVAMNPQATGQFQIMLHTIILAKNSRVFTSAHATIQNSITAFYYLPSSSQDCTPISCSLLLSMPSLKHTDGSKPLRTYIHLVSCACNLPFLLPSSFTTPPFPILSEGGGGDGPESRNGNRRLRIAGGLITH